MRSKISPYLLALLMTCGIAGTKPVMAEDATSKTSAAVAGILFEYDADEFASYSIQENGFLDVTFARNTPDALYSEILNKLQKHPDIKAYLQAKAVLSVPVFNQAKSGSVWAANLATWIAEHWFEPLRMKVRRAAG